MTYFYVNLDLSAEDKAIRDEAHKFAKEVMRPIGIELDKMPAAETVAKESPLWDFIRQAYALGFHKAAFPDIVGGLGVTPLQSHICLEELLRGSAGLAACLVLAGFKGIDD